MPGLRQWFEGGGAGHGRPCAATGCEQDGSQFDRSKGEVVRAQDVACGALSSGLRCLELLLMAGGGH